MRLLPLAPLLCFALALLACQSPAQPASEPGAATASGPAAPPPAGEPPPAPAPTVEEPLYQRSRPLMGTVVAISIVGQEDPRVSAAVDAAFDEIARLEALLSEWRPDSEISAINAAAGRGAVRVGAETLAVVRAGIEVSRWSEGAFDLSWAALRGMYTFQPGEETIPDRAEIAARLPHIDYRKVVIDEGASTVKLQETGMQIGTGGIAKGYALDRAAAVLRQAGIERYMLFGGGQVQVSGQRKGRGWRVGIQHPRRDDYFGFLEATAGSISTSGDYEHAFIRDGKRWHHIIDPRTGLPTERSVSVTVLAESGIYADALSTAVFILGPERALAKLAGAPGSPQVVIVDPELRLHVSPGTEDRLVMRARLDNGKLPLSHDAFERPPGGR
ncbi:MAG: FAD:protein FMN transferase [Myxococcales bacterium]|nr:FAD:protein FMN transferase [Myxococcales bacterium]